MIAGLLDHLWQSTLFGGGAGLLALWLRHHPARREDIAPDGQNIILPDGSERHAGYAILNCARARISVMTGAASFRLSVPGSFCL